jgi:hypothetical protein
MLGLVTGMGCGIQNICRLLDLLLFFKLHDADAGGHPEETVLPLELPVFDRSPELFSDAFGRIQWAMGQNNPELITAQARQNISVP